METPYDKGFFDAQSFESLQSARVVLPELFRYVHPQSIVDIGCGVGTWLRAAGDLGIIERLGVDGDYINRQELMLPHDRFLPVDLSQPCLADMVKASVPERFDIVLCLEVAEHLPIERSAGLVDDLCQLGDVILFSAAIPFQGGTGHVNEQWPEFWATYFRARDYTCFDLLRPLIWERSDVNWWYAQNLLVFARNGSEACALLPPEAATGTRALSRVHPEAWLSVLLNVWHRHGAAARVEEAEDFRTVLYAWTKGARLTPPLRSVERARMAPSGARNVFPFTRMDVDEPERFRAELAASEAEAATLRAENTTLSGQIGQCEAMLRATQVEMAALLASTSWRITSPLRAVGATLNRLRVGRRNGRNT